MAGLFGGKKEDPRMDRARRIEELAKKVEAARVSGNEAYEARMGRGPDAEEQDATATSTVSVGGDPAARAAQARRINMQNAIQAQAPDILNNNLIANRKPMRKRITAMQPLDMNNVYSFGGMS